MSIIIPLRYKLYNQCFHTAIALTIGDEPYELQGDTIYPNFPTLFADKRFDNMVTEVGATAGFEEIPTLCTRCSEYEKMKKDDAKKKRFSVEKGIEVLADIIDSIDKKKGSLGEFIHKLRH
ncbi:hypothetical protein TWF970_010190 [Orbilia oligospora]|uniref:Uncharacterized protein n=1 Tax=Orbilia oligospora TaxID=2813651 RepID=A0A7C8R773_ORBOL|nr:hypothetical protein TWF970_010190 [Orbilia oligospora]